MAEFKTAYLQREVPLDLDVVVAANGQVPKVGDFVVVTSETPTVQGYMQLATAAQVTGKTATHIIAQSDMTMAKGHVPVELQDYRYSPEVKGTVTAAPTTKTTTWKKVALFKIMNWDDIIPAADGSDHA